MRGMSLAAVPVRQLGAFIKGVAAVPDSHTAQALGADGWARDEHFLMLIIDTLREANWQRSKDGSKNRNRPKPVSPLAKRGKRIGNANGRSNTEVLALLDKYKRKGGSD